MPVTMKKHSAAASFARRLRRLSQQLSGIVIIVTMFGGIVGVPEHWLLQTLSNAFAASLIDVCLLLAIRYAMHGAAASVGIILMGHRAFGLAHVASIAGFLGTMAEDLAHAHQLTTGWSTSKTIASLGHATDASKLFYVFGVMLLRKRATLMQLLLIWTVPKTCLAAPLPLPFFNASSNAIPPSSDTKDSIGGPSPWGPALAGAFISAFFASIFFIITYYVQKRAQRAGAAQHRELVTALGAVTQRTGPVPEEHRAHRAAAVALAQGQSMESLRGAVLIEMDNAPPLVDDDEDQGPLPPPKPMPAAHLSRPSGRHIEEE